MFIVTLRSPGFKSERFGLEVQHKFGLHGLLIPYYKLVELETAQAFS